MRCERAGLAGSGRAMCRAVDVCGVFSDVCWVLVAYGVCGCALGC